MEIYLDNISTSKTDNEVSKTMIPYCDAFFGNASSIHKAGVLASTGIEIARNAIADELNALPEEIFFTSGGTEANNWALKGLFYANKNKGNHIIISSVEHPSILETALWLEKHGAEITLLPVNSEGLVCVDDLKKQIKKNTFLVSVMHVNNEVGSIMPVEDIGKLCKNKKILFHTDACQSFTKLKIDVKNQNIDLVTVNAHKIHGPKGVGALFIKKGTPVEALFNGGGQEKNYRSGTYNTPAIVGFGKAVEIAKPADVLKMSKLRDYFLSAIFREVSNVTLNGPSGENRVCNNINIAIDNVHGKCIFKELNKKNIYISAGSACASTKLTPSYVLVSMGQNEEKANEAIRIGLSKWTTKKELDILLKNIIEIVNLKREKYK